MSTDPTANRVERNKKLVLAFYDLLFNQCRPEEAVERFVGARYIQHNPHVADGKQAVIAHFSGLASKYPGKRVDVVRVIAERDYVVLHCRQQWPGCPDYAVVNIFRCDAEGKIIEHWDVLQEVPRKSENGNTMF